MTRPLRRWLSRDRSLLQIPRKATLAIEQGTARVVVVVRYNVEVRPLYSPPWDCVAIHLDSRLLGVTTTGRKAIASDVRSGSHRLEVRGGFESEIVLASLRVDVEPGKVTYVAIAPPKGPLTRLRRGSHRIIVARGTAEELMSRRRSLIRRDRRLNRSAIKYFGT